MSLPSQAATCPALLRGLGRTPSPELKPSSRPSPLESLPESVLLRVFEPLSHQEKTLMSQVCRSLRRILATHAPEGSWGQLEIVITCPKAPGGAESDTAHPPLTTYAWCPASGDLVVSPRTPPTGMPTQAPPTSASVNVAVATPPSLTPCPALSSLLGSPSLARRFSSVSISFHDMPLAHIQKWEALPGFEPRLTCLATILKALKLAAYIGPVTLKKLDLDSAPQACRTALLLRSITQPLPAGGDDAAPPAPRPAASLPGLEIHSLRLRGIDRRRSARWALLLLPKGIQVKWLTVPSVAGIRYDAPMSDIQLRGLLVEGSATRRYGRATVLQVSRLTALSRLVLTPPISLRVEASALGNLKSLQGLDIAVKCTCYHSLCLGLEGLSDLTALTMVVIESGRESVGDRTVRRARRSTRTSSAASDAESGNELSTLRSLRLPPTIAKAEIGLVPSIPCSELSLPETFFRYCSNLEALTSLQIRVTGESVQGSSEGTETLAPDAGLRFDPGPSISRLSSLNRLTILDSAGKAGKGGKEKVGKSGSGEGDKFKPRGSVLMDVSRLRASLTGLTKLTALVVEL